MRRWSRRRPGAASGAPNRAPRGRSRRAPRPADGAPRAGTAPPPGRSRLAAPRHNLPSSSPARRPRAGAAPWAPARHDPPAHAHRAPAWQDAARLAARPARRRRLRGRRLAGGAGPAGRRRWCPRRWPPCSACRSTGAAAARHAGRQLRAQRYRWTTASTLSRPVRRWLTAVRAPSSRSGTSREALGVGGETAWWVPPAVPRIPGAPTGGGAGPVRGGVPLRRTGARPCPTSR
jgi:hypothetical protein